jgi:hypothetical protein
MENILQTKLKVLNMSSTEIPNQDTVRQEEFVVNASSKKNFVLYFNVNFRVIHPPHGTVTQ